MSETSEPILTARDISKHFGRVVALDHADFDLKPHEILGVIGDNGAGKSTLIKAISGALQPDQGEIRLEGKPVHFDSPMEAREAGIETVYQTLALSPALSIADNMFLGREIRRKGLAGQWFRMLDQQAMEQFARQKLSDLGLLTIQNIGQAVETLSGGQRQGVAVARAAAFGSKVIIMDEPTAALGVKESRRVLELILRRQEARLADRPDLAQHAACLRGRRSRSYSSPRSADRDHRPQEAQHVGCGRDYDRRHDAAAARGMGKLIAAGRVQWISVSAARWRWSPAPVSASVWRSPKVWRRKACTW